MSDEETEVVDEGAENEPGADEPTTEEGFDESATGEESEEPADETAVITEGEEGGGESGEDEGAAEEAGAEEEAVEESPDTSAPEAASTKEGEGKKTKKKKKKRKKETQEPLFYSIGWERQLPTTQKEAVAVVEDEVSEDEEFEEEEEKMIPPEPDGDPFWEINDVELLEEMEFKPDRAFRDNSACLESFDLCALGPKERLEKLEGFATQMEVDGKIELEKWFYKCSDLQTLGRSFAKAGLYENAYICSRRVQKLFSEEIPNHPDYGSRDEQGITFQLANKACTETSQELDNIKNRLLQVYSVKHSLYLKYEYYRRRKLAKLKGTSAKPTHGKRPSFGAGSDKQRKSLKKIAPDIFWCSRTNAGFPLLLYDHQSLSADVIPDDVKKIVIPGPVLNLILKREAAVGEHLSIKLIGYLYGNVDSNTVFVQNVVTAMQVRKGPFTGLINECEVKSFVSNIQGYQLFGWIHVKPLHFPHMTATDLHVQYALQQRNPLAFAVVCSPVYNKITYFRLTKEGMDFIGACRRKELNHEHRSGRPLYEEISHQVVIDKCGNFLFTNL